MLSQHSCVTYNMLFFVAIITHTSTSFFVFSITHTSHLLLSKVSLQGFLSRLRDNPILR